MCQTKLGHVVIRSETQDSKTGEVFSLNDAMKLDQFFEIDMIATANMYNNVKSPSLEERHAQKKIADSIRVVDGVY